jgi:hypothetical protein
MYLMAVNTGWQYIVTGRTTHRPVTSHPSQAMISAWMDTPLDRLDQHERAAAMASQAATVARSITSPDRQAWALTVVARALVARGDTRHAHHAASAACAIGQWTTVLELVLSVEASALRALADL